MDGEELHQVNLGWRDSDTQVYQRRTRERVQRSARHHHS